MRHRSGLVGALVVAAGAIVGMLAAVMLVGWWAHGEPMGFLEVLGTVSGEHELLFADWIGAAGLAVGGALLGALLAVILLRRLEGGFDCPVCGTRNAEDATECSACGEQLREQILHEGSREGATPR